jgi:uncharacterized membrane protein YccC
MDAERARAIAVRLHATDVDETGTPVLRHLRRVARRTPAEARAVAWLHEAFARTDVSEQELLEAGLASDELRALRLLHHKADTRSERVYLAHLDLIARAEGRSGALARMVKIADLEDRCRHPRAGPGGWSPPYSRALRLLSAATAAGERDALVRLP